MLNIHDIDVIVTTNNRAQSLQTLVEQVLKQTSLPGKIIIVDSSIVENTAIRKYEKITYIRSSHANQPYQRYVGYLASKASLLIYLDDDMEIADINAFERIIQRFKLNDMIGLAINFVNNNEFLNQKVPKSQFGKPSKSKKGLLHWCKILSGQSVISDGQYSYNGLKGSQPKNGGQTEWFSGGAFAVRHKFMYKNFNFKLFELYEKGLGKGEDGILGYTMSKAGALYFEPEILFLHNDKKDSTYTQSFFSFNKRVIFSRLYLSYEFCRLDKRCQWKAFLSYHWYVFWRIIGVLVNQLIDYQESRQAMLKGALAGWLVALTSGKELRDFDDGSYWKEIALHDIK